jgi:hypothetical protein
VGRRERSANVEGKKWRRTPRAFGTEKSISQRGWAKKQFAGAADKKQRRKAKAQKTHNNIRGKLTVG